MESILCTLSPSKLALVAQQHAKWKIKFPSAAKACSESRIESVHADLYDVSNLKFHRKDRDWMQQRYRSGLRKTFDLMKKPLGLAQTDGVEFGPRSEIHHTARLAFAQLVV